LIYSHYYSAIDYRYADASALLIVISRHRQPRDLATPGYVAMAGRQIAAPLPAIFISLLTLTLFTSHASASHYTQLSLHCQLLIDIIDSISFIFSLAFRPATHCMRPYFIAIDIASA